MADGHKHAMRGDGFISITNCRFKPEAGHPAIVTQHFGHRAVPFDADIVLFHQAVLHDLFGPQTITPMHQRDRFADIGKIECFFNSGVATTDHRNVTILIEKAVTGRTG